MTLLTIDVDAGKKTTGMKMQNNRKEPRKWAIIYIYGKIQHKIGFSLS